jgi:hypothetical protein
MDDDDRDPNIELWANAALVFGFNELARMQQTLGQKLTCRIMRDAAEKQFRAAGGTIELINHEQVLTLPLGIGPVEFLPSDIEMMRQVVAEYDAKEGGDGG